MPPSTKLERHYWEEGYQFIAGLDEAGKGAWAGPMVCAAVILPAKTSLPKLNDSKLVTRTTRELLFDAITKQAIAIGVGIISPQEIDGLGLGEAHRQAMRSAIADLNHRVDLLLVDGKGIKQLGYKTECIVKGDAKVRCIAAASIIAKVTRDRLMLLCHEQFPSYQFCENKGYGTAAHQAALEECGPCEIHRQSYAPIARLMNRQLL